MHPRNVVLAAYVKLVESLFNEPSPLASAFLERIGQPDIFSILSRMPQIDDDNNPFEADNELESLVKLHRLIEFSAGKSFNFETVDIEDIKQIQTLLGELWVHEK